jgi:hypothetical protein
VSRNYDWVTEDMFATKLEELVSDMTTAELMAMPGFYELAREELNNEVLAALEREREPEDEPELCGYCGAPMTDTSGEVPCCSNPHCECHP